MGDRRAVEGPGLLLYEREVPACSEERDLLPELSGLAGVDAADYSGSMKKLRVIRRPTLRAFSDSAAPRATA
mgnify:CR=1 FL=1|jgi:hypothetical protein